MSPVLTQHTRAEISSVLMMHMCCSYICAILALDVVLLLMCWFRIEIQIGHVIQYKFAQTVEEEQFSLKQTCT